jgi:hypothetical protein
MSLFIGKQNTHEVANSKIELKNELQVTSETINTVTY